MFYGNSFIYNGIPSEFFNLYIGGLGDSGESTTMGSDVSLLTQKIFRRPQPFLMGVEQTPVLSFPISAYVPGELDAPEYSAVAVWLFSQQKYKQLRICQEDMQDIYFNVFFTAPEVVRVGNIIRAFNATIVCDSVWGYKSPKSYSYGDYSGYSMSDVIKFINESANSGYTYPKTLTITANVFGGSVTITNLTDNNRQFIFTLSPNEVITLDCDLQIVTSTVESYPLGNFNKHWLRFVRGYNQLLVEGNIKNMSITTNPIEVKVG